MPDRTVVPFIVRTWDPDAAGDVPPATFLRWFQEAAIRASDANGFDAARYRELGSTWVVREFHLLVEANPRMGETVEVTTWAADMERILAHRQYRAVGDGGRPIARGEAEWVYLDRKTGRPRRIDRVLAEEFPATSGYVFDDRDWGAALLDDSSGTEPAAASTHTVRWTELDGAHHVNNTVYAEWIADLLSEARDGRPGPVRRLRIRYLRGPRGGETVRWTLKLVEGTTWHFAATDEESGEPIANAIVETA